MEYRESELICVPLILAESSEHHKSRINQIELWSTVLVPRMQDHRGVRLASHQHDAVLPGSRLWLYDGDFRTGERLYLLS
jgi:hypothetical protein